ncbi:MAG: hypothetical protein HY644_15645 [Acidobacteria bacterium]|nr:hypothetical protein [Acidobacteriota bacterium]
MSKFATDDMAATGDVGLDFKYGLTPGLTLDATLKTDFSQAEVDEQQINLTRFSLFFPEKRDFFLENAGIFGFAQTREGSAPEGEILPFFSRRIGLSSDGIPLPVLGGVRLTGRAGSYSVGFLNMETQKSEPEPGNNFTVLRVKRNILAQSELGVLWINRQSDQAGDYNRTFGVESNFRMFQNLRISSFVAATRTDGLENHNRAARVWVEWKTNLLEARHSYLDIGKNFNAKVGFVPRVDIRKNDTSVGWRPRPKNPWIREFFPNARVQYITDHQNRLLTRTTELDLQAEFHSGAIFTLTRVLNFERLDAPFPIRRRIHIDPGDYNFNDWLVDFRSNPSARLSGQVRYERGDFWDGERRELQLGLTFRPHYKFSATGRYQRDELRLKQGISTSHLFNMRVHYSFSTRMFLDTLIQYNSDLRRVSSNIRFNLIHRPLSDIFIVHNEQRDAFQGGVADKSLTFKYTHMLDLF